MRVGRGRFFCFRELRWKKRDLFRERRARFGKARRRWTKKAKQRGEKTHQPRERQLPDQQLGRALVLADLAEGDGARAVAPLGCFFLFDVD